MGRPRYNITRELLLELSHDGFSAVEIAKICKVNHTVIYDRAREFGIVFKKSAAISNELLKEMIKNIQEQFPHYGKGKMQTAIRCEYKVHIPQRRVFAALREIDPIGAGLRWCKAIVRRIYDVPGPHYLWHMDTNHKLISWRFVIFGVIDGYSRYCLCLKVDDNNKAATWLDYFTETEDKFALPERVRGDCGGENVEVARYMCRRRPRQNKPFIAGRSVHDQRIERLWGDVIPGCLWKYSDLFTLMEENHGLNPDDDVHIYALHVVFMTQIQLRLDKWRNHHNNHKIRTVKKSPTSMLQEECNEPLNTSDQYGIDWQGPIPRRINHVTILEIPSDVINPLIHEAFGENIQNLRTDVDGVFIWCKLVRLMNRHITIEHD